MMTFFKAGLFFIAVSSSFILSSCNKADNDVIPDVFVDFTIDLLDPEFVNLSVIGNSDTIDASTNNWGYKSAGYDGNGIIIYSGPDEYFAYDRTCPYDYAVNDLSVKVKIDFTVAVCPNCGTKYSLSAYGTPISGTGKYPLKNYKTSLDEDRYIRVWNE
jgi:nitrite reductase/ring-hydroxylating ferredoxin subunit